MEKTLKKIRTRYAPSPTGYLHIGGARTALFCYLYAKHFNGDFIIRIEDTDTARNIAEGEKSQLENLSWLKIIPDESPIKPNKKYAPYRQSERKEIYKKYIKQLIDQGDAYQCFCTREELETEKQKQLLDEKIKSPKYNQKCRKLSQEEIDKYNREKKQCVYRLKINKDKIYQWNDLIRGNIQFNSDEIEDFVIARSDFIPTYNFGVVIDDYLMEITHVLRGEEHITNTSKQLAIYEMLNWEPPKFGHLTIITNEHKQKLSKRDLNTVQFISDFKNQGFLPETIVNYLAQLGWTADSKKEIFTLEELVKLFDIKNLSKSPSQFDILKMEWMNSQYIKLMSDEEYVKYSEMFINETNKKISDKHVIKSLILLFKKEILKFDELNRKFNEFYDFNISKINLLDLKNLIDVDKINNFYDRINLLNDWTEDSIKNLIKNFGQENKISGKELYMPIRQICTFNNHGPELAKCILLIGKKQVINNINEVKIKLGYNNEKN